ncbi:MAG: MFS transporter [Nocardioidaceae bacterium]|nr:MFS transporter [Nocardioidaceae bacterium]
MTSTVTAPAGTSRWVALGVIAVAQLMVALDATIVNVALPTAQRALDFDDAQRSWVITAYTLSFAGLLLLGGRLADRVGRRRAMMTGLVGFAASSALAGAAPSFGVLVAGRALQGGFAAMMAPAALSLIAVTFTEPRERGKAFGIFGAVASSGAVTGLLLGGALTEYAGWRWCLYVNVLIAAGALLVGSRALPRGDGYPAPVDVISGVLATAGLAAVVYGASEAATHGWSSARVLVPGLTGLGLGMLFLLRQRLAAHPLLPLSILADRSRASAYLATATSVIGTFGMFLMLTYHFQVVLGYSPLHTGVAFLPLNVAVIASSGLASRLMTSAPARVLVAPGLLVAAVGLTLLTRLSPDSGYATLILPAMVLVGLGVGMVFTPSIGVATSGVDPRMAGVAAATANTAMQIGGSVGTAVLNTIAIDATSGFGGSPAAAIVHGFATATGWAAVVLVVVAAVVALGLDARAHTHR